jgi:hypothetical protein
VGAKTATLDVSAAPGGSASAALTGTSTGQPAMLSASPPSHDFGSSAIGVATQPFTFSITNAGDLSSGIPTFTNTNPGEFSVTNECTTALVGRTACNLTVSFKPTAGGLRSATLSLAASPGGTLQITVTGSGLHQVTVTSRGTGTVTSSPPGISCPPTCSALYDTGTSLTLQARTANGSGFFFSGWSGGGCSGPFHDCAIMLSANTAVSATFSAMSANLVFVSSTTVLTNLGSAVAYDARCNAAASSVGINNAAGDAYIALTSDAASLAKTRLGANARGWIRMDGKPFADSQASLFTTHQIFNVIGFSEDGLAQRVPMATGTAVDGSLSASGNCSNWTGTGNVASGFSYYGPKSWTEGAFFQCIDQSLHLVCMGKTANAAVAPPTTMGRLLWLTLGFAPGGAETADAHCQANRPAGVTTAAALIAHPGRAASAVLNATTNYIRSDGTLVGTGADIAMGQIASGIWQYADQSYVLDNVVVLTGQTSPSLAGTAATTCNDWVDATAQSNFGSPLTTVSDWWARSDGVTFQCGTSALFCVQTAP